MPKKKREKKKNKPNEKKGEKKELWHVLLLREIRCMLEIVRNNKWLKYKFSFRIGIFNCNFMESFKSNCNNNSSKFIG